MTHTHNHIHIYIYRQTYSYDIPWFHVNIPPSKWTKANSQVMQIPLVLVALSQEEQARQPQALLFRLGSPWGQSSKKMQVAIM